MEMATTNDARPSSLSRRSFLKAAGAGSAVVLATAEMASEAAESDSPTLPQRPLGKTGERVCALGLGTAPAGHRSRDEAAEFFEQAISLGVTYLDTAPEFTGYGLAQQALADVLKTRRRQVFLVTKCYEPGGDEALKLLEANLKELQTDYADLVYAHSLGADKMDPATVRGESGVLAALQRAREQGLCRFVGISGHNRPQRFVDVLQDFPVDAMMNAVNPVARHIYNFEERVWPVAREKGVGLVAMKVLGGAHRAASDPATQPRSKGGRIRGDAAQQAFRYAMGLSGLSTVVLGCYDLEELKQAIEWTRSFAPLPETELSRILADGKRLAAEWGEVYGPVA
jgi:hypothetical protein